MRTQAAVLIDRQWTIRDLELDEPRAGEVRVRFAYAGLCHSDLHLQHGGWTDVPVVGGHEGAGVVDAVGPGVSRLAPGDHVVVCSVPACGHCRWCQTGRPSLCDAMANAATGLLADGTFRFRLDDEPIGGHCVLGTFAEMAVVNQDACIRIADDIPLDVAALVSCGVLSGWGAAVHAGPTRVGDTVIVIGAGGVGLNAVQGAAYAGAMHVIAVDPAAHKRDLARELGASCATDSVAEAATLAAGLNPSAGGADVTVVSVGAAHEPLIEEAFHATGKGGCLVLASLSDDFDERNVRLPGSLIAVSERRIQGTSMGSCNFARDIPLLLDLYRARKVKLTELISATYPLADIERGFHELRTGATLRGLIAHSAPDTKDAHV